MAPVRTTPDRATLRRAIRALRKVLRRDPADLHSVVRLARAHRLLGEKKLSAECYRRAIEGHARLNAGARALALAKELLCVEPADHDLLLQMARLQARLPREESSSGRVAVPIDDAAARPVSTSPRDFTATSAKALEILDDLSEVERVEPALRAEDESAGFEETPQEAVGDEDVCSAAMELEERAQTPLEPHRPPPPPPEAFAEQENGEEQKREEPEAEIIEEQPALPQASPEVSALPPQLPPPPQAFCEHEDGERAEPVDLEEEPKEQLPAPPDPSSPPSPPDSSPPPPPPQAFTDAARPPSTEAASRAPEDAPPSVIDLKRPAPKKPPVTSLRGNLVRLALSRSPLFRMLPEERRLDIAGRFEERRVQAGEAVLAPGQVTLGLYVLLEGRVRITVREGGEAALLAELERGALFGCVAALTGMPTLASAVCLEDGLLSVLPHRAFNELVEIHPELPGLLRREDLLIAPTVFVGERRGAAGA